MRLWFFIKVLVLIWAVCLTVPLAFTAQAIAKCIARGAVSTGAEVKMVRLKNADYAMMDEYDLIVIGSPVWKADTPNMHAFIDRMPHQNGKHCFAFNTHGTIPHLYFPIVLPNLKKHGLLPIGYADWYR